MRGGHRNSLGRTLEVVAAIDQASTQWTLALPFDLTRDLHTPHQRARSVEIVKQNLAGHDDWIVLDNSMQVLVEWSHDDAELADWNPSV